MKKSSSQRILVTQDEFLRIQSYVNKSIQSHSKLKIKPKSIPQQCQFKPEINKQSINLQRTINDLYRWNLNKLQKINQIKEEEIREIQNNANRLTHQITSSSVFNRLYQTRKTSAYTIQQSKRNTHQDQPYYTKNMTKSMYQEYQRQFQHIHNNIQSKSKTQTTEQSQMQTPIQYDLDQELPLSINNMKISVPIHQYFDLNKQIQNSSDQSNLQEKDIEVMVEKLNNWQAKKLERELFIAQEYNNQQISGHSQNQPKNYSNIFLNI
ncbi:unnamed protein product [Paramecium pentaurelia]|uniref:Uncharacterized protein n=1 Tax=Paramecium pentaurelia TaxID=43138 RepID=A0A8S1XDS2_9CILI|nr:unnamed protein product [Paramecium pentaurelia]